MSSGMRTRPIRRLRNSNRDCEKFRESWIRRLWLIPRDSGSARVRAGQPCASRGTSPPVPGPVSMGHYCRWVLPVEIEERCFSIVTHERQRYRRQPPPGLFLVIWGSGRNAAVFGVAPPREGAAWTRSALLECGSVTLRTRTAIPGLPDTDIRPNGAPNHRNDTMTEDTSLPHRRARNNKVHTGGTGH